VKAKYSTTTKNTIEIFNHEMTSLIKQADESGNTLRDSLLRLKLQVNRRYHAERETEGPGLHEVLARLMARVLLEIRETQQDTFRRCTEEIEEAEASRILDDNALRIKNLDRVVHCLNESFDMIEIMGAEEFLLYILMEALGQPSQPESNPTEQQVENPRLN
jgi:DNA anti-recombination protein RmuC